MFSPIIDLINQIDNSYISDHRKDLLKPLHDYLALKIKQKKAINLNFICTHNSRRSQLSQVWAKVIADFYGININSFSGGIQITACNKRTIASLTRMGFKVNDASGENPHYELSYHSKKPIISLFSKMH
ncbi:MAG: protein-tyrosine-phosphatase, partial [Bacteroidota bacterium]|nr:protein-tyrosine-phosphatase [Bacteroidota bacterium]